MKFNLITIQDFLRQNKLTDYYIIDKDSKLSLFKNSLHLYKQTIIHKNQDSNSETNQIPVFNKLLTSIYNYHFEIDLDKIDISIWDNLKLKVIIEAKRESNKGEMIKDNDINKKALHEALLYYYEQRQKNVFSVNHIIITDYTTIYLFNAKEFEDLINNKTILDLLSGYKNKELLLIQRTKELYEELARILKNIDINLEACKIELFDNNLDIENTYRILDRYNLLQTPFENKEHNILDPKFYNELLYIMGLQEVEEKVDGKNLPIIKPLLQSGTSNNSNLMTMVIKLIERARASNKIDNKLWSKLGDDDHERYFNMALELVLTWINRILFLKLLEAQLISYHKESKDITLYQFLKFDKDILSNWDDIDRLFFEILAKPLETREYKHIPYLNSALFEETDYEKYISVSLLNDRDKLDISKESILTEKTAKPVLEYLLEFLDSYNFGRGDDGISESKRLINASVLGLIFEQLNGYKDGAIYTPSFITMSMSRDSLIQTVIQKFNDTYQWTCKSLIEVSNHIIQHKINLIEANKVFDSIRIVDPAVGSGHFLVSVLNELLYIKHHGLGILSDKDGRLIRCDMDIIADELLIKCNDDTDFVYHVNKDNKPLDSEMQRIQETLFHQKETLIENCLFGVDINPKSAYICQLRLWIELLKNTYYIQIDDKIENLKTLPNIDINIKTGNSLVSKFDLRHDFSTMMGKPAVKEYRKLVSEYKNTHDKIDKLEIKQKIAKIKIKFRKSFEINDVDYKILISKYSKAKQYYESIEFSLVEVDQKKIDKAFNEMNKAETALENSDSTYTNSMEWLYEFPEVLDDDGKFVGFDLVIGNPPYFKYNKKHHSHISQINYFRNNSLYSVACIGEINAYEVFLMLSYQLCKKDGFICEIFQNSFLADRSSKGVRKFYLENTNIIHINSFPERDSPKKRVFEKVKMSVMTLLSQKKAETTIFPMAIYSDRMVTAPKQIIIDTNIIKTIDSDSMEIPNLNEKELLIFAKCYTNNSHFNSYVDIMVGELDITLCKKYFTDDKTKTPFLVGANVQKYYITDTPSQRTVPLYFDKETYLSEKPTRKSHIESERLVCQGISGINDKYRLIFSIAPKNIGLGNSLNYMILKENSTIDLYFILGLMNSWLLNWLFKARSTNANVNNYEVERLPIPTTTPEQQQKISVLVSYLLFLHDKNNPQLISHTSNKRIAVHIANILDMVVYELYFEEHMKEQKIDVIQYLTPSPLTDSMSNDEKSDIIREFYLWYQSSDNDIRQRILLIETRSPNIIYKINQGV